MKFELDEYYFNRAGDKVKYVGRSGYFPTFRDTDGNMFAVGIDGKHGIMDNTYDVIGKWEITNDPERVYVINGSKYTYDLIKFYFSVERVEKILIKPLNLMPGKIEYVEDTGELHKKIYGRVYDRQEKMLEILASVAHLKKIKPADICDGATQVDLHLTFKLNELIAAYNAGLKCS